VVTRLATAAGLAIAESLRWSPPGGFTFRPARHAVVSSKLAGHRHQAEALRHAQNLPRRVLRYVLRDELAHAVGDDVGQLVAVVDDGPQPGHTGRAVVPRCRVLQRQRRRVALR